MRALCILIAAFALAGCGDGDCPSSASGGSTCSSNGLTCDVEGYRCTCDNGQWDCVTSDDARFMVHDLAVRDLTTATD